MVGDGSKQYLRLSLHSDADILARELSALQRNGVKSRFGRCGEADLWLIKFPSEQHSEAEGVRQRPIDCTLYIVDEFCGKHRVLSETFSPTFSRRRPRL